MASSHEGLKSSNSLKPDNTGHFSISKYLSSRQKDIEEKKELSRIATDTQLSREALEPFEEFNPVHHPDFLSKARTGTVTEREAQEFLDQLDEEYCLTEQLNDDGEYMWIGPGMGGVDYVVETIAENNGRRDISMIETSFDNPYFLHENPEMSDELRVIRGDEKEILQARNPHRDLDDWQDTTHVETEFSEKGIEPGEMLYHMNESVARKERNGDLLVGIRAEEGVDNDASLEEITETPLGTMYRFQDSFKTSNSDFSYEEQFIELEGYGNIETRYDTPQGKMTKLWFDMAALPVRIQS